VFGRRNKTGKSPGPPTAQTAPGPSDDPLDWMVDRLRSVRIEEMPAIESAVLNSVGRTIAGAAPGADLGNDVVLAFFDAFISTTGLAGESSPPSPSVRTFRSEFVRNSHRFAMRAGVNELFSRMLPAVDDQLRTHSDTATRAVMSAAWMFTAIASGDGRAVTMEQLLAGATEAVRGASVPTREVVIGPDNAGRRLVDALKQAYGVDEWSSGTRNGVTWYPGRLATTISHNLVGVEKVGALHEVTIMTSLARDVPVTDASLALLTQLNEGAGGDALVLDEGDGVVRSELSVVAHDGNEAWIAPVLKMVGMAAIDINEARADLLAVALGGQVAVAAHPELGERAEPDEMLGIVTGSLWPSKELPTGDHFWREVVSAMGDLGPTTVTGSGFTSEIPYSSATTGIQSALTGREVGTALLAIGTADVLRWHEASARVRLGDGVTFRCGLPVRVSDGPRLANRLNADRPKSRPHRLGAWYSRDDGLWLTMHLPAAALPNDERNAAIVIANLGMGILARAFSAAPILR
jgi:hypothetical protein